jgi:Flp pilus assembly protein TadG
MKSAQRGSAIVEFALLLPLLLLLTMTTTEFGRAIYQ